MTLRLVSSGVWSSGSGCLIRIIIAKNYRKQKSARAAVKVHSQHREYRHYREGNAARPIVDLFAEHGIDRMPAVELARRDEIQSGDQQPDPRGEIKSVPDTHCRIVA